MFDDSAEVAKLSSQRPVANFERQAGSAVGHCPKSIGRIKHACLGLRSIKWTFGYGQCVELFALAVFLERGLREFAKAGKMLRRR